MAKSNLDPDSMTFDEFMRIGASYARISTGQQREGASLETQDAQTAALAESKGFIIPPEYRFHEIQSGADRPVQSWTISVI